MTARQALPGLSHPQAKAWTAAYHAGYDARVQGRPMDDCPHSRCSGLHAFWFDGWLDAVRGYPRFWEPNTNLVANKEAVLQALARDEARGADLDT